MPVLTCSCGQKVRVPEDKAGARFRCPKCSQLIEGPPAVALAEPLPPPEATPVAVERRPRPQDEELDSEPRERGVRPRLSGLAVTSLILGLATLICLPLGIVGLILGVMGLISISGSNGRIRGTGLAISGIAVSALMTGLMGAFGYWFYTSVLSKAFDVAKYADKMQSQNDLKEIGNAMHQYHSERSTFPPAAIYGPDSKALLSWRVAILPYLNDSKAESLYRRFRLNEPWDSPHNLALLPEIPDVYRSTGNHATRYQVFTGPGTPFEGNRGISIPQIRDGSSNTVLVVEAADSVAWTKPQDLVYDPKKPLPRFHSRGGAGFSVLFADGSVRSLRENPDENEMRKIITANDGSVVDLSRLDQR